MGLGCEHGCPGPNHKFGCELARPSTAPNADRIADLEALVEKLGQVVYEHEDTINTLIEAEAENQEAHTNLHRRIQNRKNAIKTLTERVESHASSFSIWCKRLETKMAEQNSDLLNHFHDLPSAKWVTNRTTQKPRFPQ